MIRYFMWGLAMAVGLILAPQGVLAQQEPVFSNYEEMRKELDALMQGREIEKLMNRFGGASDLSLEEVQALEARMRDRFPYDFKHADLVKVDEMQNGWRQELYAYYTGLKYVFVTVLIHEREDSLIALNIKFDIDFYRLIGSF